ncbi:MAG: CehA/McbA family metallohydrolase [Victivallales bacterium]|nr:CehA/McbA family metallohydrolase [Victivallales bacterium]
MERIDVFGLKKNRYKVNLHTHTTNSDGSFSPSEIVDLYRGEGYDALALTDHRQSNKISELDGGEMTLISGIETHPIGPRGITLHLIGLGLSEDFADLSELPFQKCVDAINDAGGLCFLAHPYWSGLTVEDMLQFSGYLGVEVYNNSCVDVGREFNVTHWDQLLEHRSATTCIAVDDTHGESHLFGGWTIVCAEDKRPETLLAALRKNQFHASTGPNIFAFDVDFEKRSVYAEFSLVDKAIVMSKASAGSYLKTPFHGVNVNAENGYVEKDGVEREFFQFTVPESMTYFRCEITDSDGRMAWTNTVEFK